jgi:hypothetical protein
MDGAKNRCQPRLLCTRTACNGHATAAPYYPHPCHPWPVCAAKLPSGGYSESLKPLTPDERHKVEIANVLKSYDAAAGYDADPSVGKVAEVVERGSTGPAAFENEFDQR